MKTRKVDGFTVIPSVWAGIGQERKRGLRILPKSGDYFVHVTSRTTGQNFLFGDEEKVVFRDLVRRWADFSGIGVITHCLMDNHFHLLLWVPRPEKLDHAEILRRLERVWPEWKLKAWEELYQSEPTETQESLDASLVERMGDLPAFMRVLKQGFSCWYNRRTGRKGTLWDARYRSVVVEGNPLALLSVAAYIDLNPIRAGLCVDPMDYPWSGYGEACGGGKVARVGLEQLVRLSRGIQPVAVENLRLKQIREETSDLKEVADTVEEEKQRRAVPKGWKEVQAVYRVWLYSKGESLADRPYEKKSHRERKGFDPAEVVAEFERQGFVPLAERLLHRARFFTKGAGFGSAAFLQGLMEEYRSCFGGRRKKAARQIKGGWEGLKSLRQVG